MKFKNMLAVALLSVFSLGEYASAQTIATPSNANKESVKMSAKQIITTDKSSPAFGPFVQALVKDGVLYTSGLMPFMPGSGDLVSPNLEEQMHQSMRNMKAVLEAANMTLDDLIIVTIYTTDMAEFATLNKIYGSYFEGNIFPSRAAVGVSALAKGARVELVAMAKK
jgi:2-iminobutanoate/2-iminopropanoate deaminase